MLSIDHQRVISGVTVFRDFQDENQFFFLPDDKVRIADNGKGIQFVAYIDGEVKEGTEPDFTDDMDRNGGFLTLEVELGPTESEIEQIKQALSSEVGSDVKLAQVPFKEGSVKLVMFGSTGGGDQNQAVRFSVAGSSKPSLFGKQTAVFSLQLGGKEAQIMWSLLKHSSQTQVGIVYDLSFLGVMPAYHLEITVDFKATEDYWQHHIDADFGLESENLKIVSNNDIDLIMRDLVNTGAITIKQVDFTGTGEGNPLGSDDPNGMKLIRELLSPTLFDASAIPREDYNVLGSTLPSGGGATTPSSTSTPTRSSTTTTTPRTPSRTTSASTTPSTTTPTRTTATPTRTATPSMSTSPTRSTTPSNTTSPSINRPPDNDNPNRTPSPSPSVTNPPRHTPTTPVTPGRPTPTSPPTSPTGPTPTGPPATTPTTEQPTTPTTPGGGDNTPERVGTKISINAGYSLKHRRISQKMKRTYVFDKAEAKVHAYHPSGALSTEGTQFDKDKQVQLVRLGEGPFKEIEIEIRSALNFADYKIREAIVHLSYGFRNTDGDKTERLHEVSVMVNATKPRKVINFFVDQFGTLEFDYFVEFIHEPGSIIGTHETKIRSRTFENTTVRDIAINIDDHSPLIPVEIQPGHLTFSNEGVQAVHLFIAPEKEANGKTVIIKEGATSLSRFLIFPTKKEEYKYFKKEEFFFKEDSVVEEFENLTDSQVIVNRPETRVLNIAPILVNSGNLISKAIVKVKYENGEGDELERSLVLVPTNDSTTKEFAIIVEEEDPRIWTASTQFLLTNGDIIEGREIGYRIEQPFISLKSTGLKVLKIATMLGQATFANNIAAVQVQVFDSATTAGAQPEETINLRPGNIEETVILKDVPDDTPLAAVATVFKKDGTDEVINVAIPAGSDEVLLRIFNV